MKCECPNDSVGGVPEWLYELDELKARIHTANNCQGDVDLKLYQRKNKRLVLCSACNLSDDVEVMYINE